MGVKDLWKVLGPIGIKNTLFELSNKKVAIDLSCWVCENQIIGEKYVPCQAGMHLRNVFFRTSMLLMLNVTPIFVLDGKAPEIKHDTLAKRKQARFNRKKPETDSATNKKNGNRNRLKSLLKQCKVMLEMMGVKCLESEGEGEALCAQLNKDKIVDGVISQDSDVFLYGARTVYRNFTLQGGNGSIEVFKMEDIENTLKLTLDKLIAMSLLCGCDYDDAGVHGIGKEKALLYLQSFEGKNVLDRLRDWRTDKELDRYENERLNCPKCSHPGKLKEHNKQGCQLCCVTTGCTEDSSPSAYRNLSEEKKNLVNVELTLRRKAIVNPTFPEEDIISEFLTYRQNLPELRFNWKQPKVTNFVQYSSSMLEWDPQYAFKKILPLATRWQLLNSNYYDFVPEKILKKRIVKGIPNFDVLWSIVSDNVKFLMDTFEFDAGEESENLQQIVTTEPQILIIDKLQLIYGNYQSELEKEKAEKLEKRRKGKAKKPVEPKPKTGNRSRKKKILTDVDLLTDEIAAITIDKPEFCTESSKELTGTEKCEDHYSKNNSLTSEEKLEKDETSDTSISDLSRNLTNCSVNDFNRDFNWDDSTVSYDFANYDINESAVIDSILSRKQFY